MRNSVRSSLKQSVLQNYGERAPGILPYLPDCPIDFPSVRAVMINEIVADTPEDDFYGSSSHPRYMETALPLFHRAGVEVDSVSDILNLGIYITSAVKLPKETATIETGVVRRFVPILRQELALFPSLRVIMLMGDVAKKALNMIAKEDHGKNAIPTGSTYKLRHTEIRYGDIRLLPAYIMTGKNLAIEPSKTEMSAEEITKMMDLIRL